jgi:hypothetical protein
MRQFINRKFRQIIGMISLLFFCCGCNNTEDEAGETDIPESKNLTEYTSTEFILSPKHKLSEGKNSIYCVSFLLAWDKLKADSDMSFKIPDTHFDLQLVNSSFDFLNSLSEEEIDLHAEISEDRLYAKAYFKKSLPFEMEFIKEHGTDEFAGNKVRFFGCSGSDHLNLTRQLQIIYYKNDSEFIVRLRPDDPQHRIYLYMPNEKPENFETVFKDMYEKLLLGEEEMELEEKFIDYQFMPDDDFAMPVINFNIENEYQQLIGNKVFADEKTFVLTQAEQQIALVLNEKGAEAESKAEVALSKSEEPEEELSKPKRLYLNKPFLLVLKKQDSQYPYLAIWIENTELMVAK